MSNMGSAPITQCPLANNIIDVITKAINPIFPEKPNKQIIPATM